MFGRSPTLEQRQKTSQRNTGLVYSKERRLKHVGENNGRAKLTWDLVNKIHQEYSPGQVSYSDLAKKYGVARCVIARIITGKAWKMPIE